MTNHPITPPPELLQQWSNEFWGHPEPTSLEDYFATQAARWGADMELEACVEWLQDPDLNVDTGKLREARRPKPLSLKEQALRVKEQALRVLDDCYATLDAAHENILRRALEALDD